MKIITLLMVIFSSLAMAGELPLKGKATYSWFVFDVYDAKLWSAAKGKLYESPLKLELAYKRELKGKDITEQTVKELLHAGHSESTVSKWIKPIQNLFPDVKEGDRILASYGPQKGVTLYFNGKKVLGTIKDRKFSHAFLDIWLGEKASDPDFRNKLLGGKL